MTREPETLTPTSGKFRRRATIVEARKLTRENAREIMAWVEGRPWSRPPMRAITGVRFPHPTAEGDAVAEFGDWIVQLGDGNFRVWSDERFRDAYEPVPAVARDEAAELRAAIHEWVEASDAAEAFDLDQTNAYGTDYADAEDRRWMADHILRAFAGTDGAE